MLTQSAKKKFYKIFTVIFLIIGAFVFFETILPEVLSFIAGVVGGYLVVQHYLKKDNDIE